MFNVSAVELFCHGILYIQPGVASGACYKRFTLCRKYLDAYLETSGVMLIIMKSGSIRNVLLCLSFDSD